MPMKGKRTKPAGAAMKGKRVPLLVVVLHHRPLTTAVRKAIAAQEEARAISRLRWPGLGLGTRVSSPRVPPPFG